MQNPFFCDFKEEVEYFPPSDHGRLIGKISTEFVERLGLYGQVNPESQKQLAPRILRELNEFNYLVQIIKAYDSSEFGTELQIQFEGNKALFSALFSEVEE